LLGFEMVERGPAERPGNPSSPLISMPCSGESSIVQASANSRIVEPFVIGN